MSARYRPAYTVGRPTDSFKPRRDGLYEVTVVGNGPLHESDRVAINRSANVVRFNDMNHWRTGEPTSLRVVRYPSALQPHHHCNASVWAVAASPHSLPLDAKLHTWIYARGLTHWSLAKPQHIIWPTAQVLEPWADSVRLFEGCRSCGYNCYTNQTSAGPSTGAWILSELDAMPSVSNISVYGMNWGGGLEHVDFTYPNIVPDCCSKCTIHKTASSNYGDGGVHWTQDLQNVVATASASGVVLVLAKVAIGAFAVFHGGKAVQKKIKERAETAAVQQQQATEASLAADRKLGADRMPLLGLALAR